MAMIRAQAPWPDTGETPEERVRRVEREAAFIAASHAAMDAGHGMKLDTLLDRFDALDAESEASADQPVRGIPGGAGPRR